MSPSPEVTLGEVCAFQNGGTPSKAVGRYFQGTIPWITGADITSSIVSHARSFITAEAVENSATNCVPKGTVLLVTRTSVGKVAIAGMDLCFSQDITALTPDSTRLYAPFLVAYLRTQTAHFERLARGATIKGITREVVANLKIPLPSVTEQKQIAEALDRVENVGAKRRAAITQVDNLTMSIFMELFGDPALNSRGWPYKTIGELAAKFSDGPFGSNLKTSHYTKTGIRVIRLQNIGVGEFIDDDKMYISERHFAELKRHECRPGDVLIGTLGDPNLRACIQPNWLKIALNKADCVQLRPDERIADSFYVCALLNLPSVARMAQDLIVGQTRLRISMGRLRGLRVPLPPLDLQREFARRIAAAEKLKSGYHASLTDLDELFAAVQHQAFKGEL